MQSLAKKLGNRSIIYGKGIGKQCSGLLSFLYVYNYMCQCRPDSCGRDSQEPDHAPASACASAGMFYNSKPDIIQEIDALAPVSATLVHASKPQHMGFWLLRFKSIRCQTEELQTESPKHIDRLDELITQCTCPQQATYPGCNC